MIDTFLCIILSLWIAIFLDVMLGEPRRFHPLVGFGYLANRFEYYTNHTVMPPWLRLSAGALGWLLLVIGITALLSIVIRIANSTVSIELWLDAIILYLAIGFTSLRQHGQAVLDALLNNDLPQARQQVGRIVSRDTAQMSHVEVRKATIESILENGSDAVFAPVFWFVIGGAPAVILYRLSNTLDAMWGYKTERFLYFGRFAARMDDILNWLPSRLVALTYSVSGATRTSIQCWQQQASQLESPAGGVVMTAGAGALQIRLGGIAHYHGKCKSKPEFGCGHEPQNHDIKRSLRLIECTLAYWCMAMTLVYGIVRLLGMTTTQLI